MLLNAELRRLHAASGNSGKGTIAQVRAEARALNSALGSSPAAGPVLLGAATLVLSQARERSRQGWVLERAALLNGGDEFVRQMVPFLGFFLRVHSDCGEAGTATSASAHGSAGYVVLSVRDDCQLTTSELRILALLLRRLASRQPVGRRPCGTIESIDGKWTATQSATLISRLVSLIQAWGQLFLVLTG